MDATKTIQELSLALGIPEVFEQYKNRLFYLDTDYIRVGIAGGANAGKTTLISSLAAVKIPVSGIASSISFVVKPGDEVKYYMTPGNKFDSCPDLSSIESGETLYVESTNLWLSNHRIVLKEIIEKSFEEGDLELNFHVSDIDICVYVINSLNAYTKDDAIIINTLHNFGIPTIVVFSHTDTLRDNDELLSTSGFKEVQSIIPRYFAGKDNVKVLFPKEGAKLSDLASEIVQLLSMIISTEKIEGVRTAQANLFTVSAIASLYAQSEEFKNEVEEKEKQVQDNAITKKNKISFLEGEWARIELELTKRRQDCEDLLRSQLESKKEDMTRRLFHELDTVNDIKKYWETDLSYRIDETMRAELQSLSQQMNAKIVNTLRWLQDELIKTFRRKSFVAPTVSFIVDGNPVVMDNIELSDNKKLKIVTRVGTVATVIAAGTLMATSRVAGVVMAISMVSGLGADWFIDKKSNESREKVKSLLPSIIGQTILSYVVNISTSLKESYSEIISNLRNSQQEWKVEMEKEIEEEYNIAIFNTGRSKYNDVIEQLNKLSETVLDE